MHSACHFNQFVKGNLRLCNQIIHQDKFSQKQQHL